MVPPGWYVQVQEAIVIKPENKPEPDVAVVPAELEYDATRDPLAVECYLVVEVAESSLEYDRTKKLGALCHGRHSGLLDRQPDRPGGRGLLDPVGAACATPTVLGEGELVEVEVAGQVVGTIAVASLLPALAGGGDVMTSQVLAGLLLRSRSSRSASCWATTPRSASGARDQVERKPGDRIVVVSYSSGGESIIDLDRVALIEVEGGAK